jgi:hypothetical protein
MVGTVDVLYWETGNIEIVCCGVLIEFVENYLLAIVERRLLQTGEIVGDQIPFLRSISFFGHFHFQDFEEIKCPV